MYSVNREVFVNREKQRNLIKAANAYLEKKKLMLRVGLI